jgi:hypothetical protein
LTKAINLFIWGDSLSFRRPFQPDDFGLTYPFLLQKKLKDSIGCEVNLMVRSRGGITIPESRVLINGDCNYLNFRKDDGILNVAVLQYGIVDCGLLPFTYPLLRFFLKVPLIGGKVVYILKKSRNILQKISSKPRTSKKEFLKNYNAITRLLADRGFLVFGIGLPTPNNEMELRSPGFQKSTSEYNELIRGMVENFVDIEQHISGNTDVSNSEDFRDEILIKEDGHHLTQTGHKMYAELISEKIVSVINSNKSI